MVQDAQSGRVQKIPISIERETIDRVSSCARSAFDLSSRRFDTYLPSSRSLWRDVMKVTDRPSGVVPYSLVYAHQHGSWLVNPLSRFSVFWTPIHDDDWLISGLVKLG